MKAETKGSHAPVWLPIHGKKNKKERSSVKMWCTNPFQIPLILLFQALLVTNHLRTMPYTYCNSWTLRTLISWKLVWPWFNSPVQFFTAISEGFLRWIFKLNRIQFKINLNWRQTLKFSSFIKSHISLIMVNFSSRPKIKTRLFYKAVAANWQHKLILSSVYLLLQKSNS